MDTFVGCAGALGVIAAILGISYLVTAGLVWLFCWLVPMLGYTLPFAFSWGNALIVWVLLAVIKLALGGITVNARTK